MHTVLKKSMRDALIEGIHARMRVDPSLFFVSADFGAPQLDSLRVEFPQRFLNVGIAEQNLINVCTGLALEGRTVFAYLIAPFVMRAYEQIRVNLAISTTRRPVNVNILGVGAGLSYEVSGPTHHCLEDLAIMRLLPNFHVLSPSDWCVAGDLLDYAIDVRAPKYFRLDGKPLPALPAMKTAQGYRVLRNGEDVCLVATGFMAHRALEVAELLATSGIQAKVVDVYLVKPVHDEALASEMAGYRLVVSLEEAFGANGGLDSLVTKALRCLESTPRFLPVSLPDGYTFEVGDRSYLHGLVGLDPSTVAQRVATTLAKA